jgi:hypothetical protein
MNGDLYTGPSEESGAYGRSRPVDDVVFVFRERRTVAAEPDALGPGRKKKLIAETDLLHEGFDIVITVGASAQDPQDQVDLGR